MKKIISMILMAALILTSGVPAFAESTDSKGLETAITAAKKVITVPSEYKEFEYLMNSSDKDGKKEINWDLSWNNSDGTEGISVTVNDDGYITMYQKHNSNQKREGLGKITKEMAKKTAQDFLSKARPDFVKNMRLLESDDSNIMSYILKYKIYQNDVVISFMESSLEVDKFTGEVTSYYGLAEDLPALPGKEGIISKNAAEKTFLDNAGVELKYHSNYDYNKKTLTIFPAYSVINQNKVIDAKTGKLVSIYDDHRYFANAAAGAKVETSLDSAKQGLTKEELSGIQSVSSLISKEKAESLARNGVTAIPSSMKISDIHLSKDQIEKEQYYWEMGFDGGYVKLNATTGEIVSFYLYLDEKERKTTGISEETAKNTAEVFLKKIAGEKFAQMKETKVTAYPGPYLKDMNMDTDSYSFYYERLVNGIPFADNSMSVTVNKGDGKITHYDCGWFDKAIFPTVEKAMTLEKTFDVIDQECQFDLMYVKTEKDITSLVYGFKEDASFLLEPVKGTKLGWDGKPYSEMKTPVYSDLKGQWCESTVNSLLENGYYIEGDKFSPKSKMTQVGFLRYLYSHDQSYYDEDEFYNMLKSNEIVLENEKAPNTELTRQGAAKFATRYLGQGKSAEHPEIFLNPFKDEVKKEYRGYAAICYGLGVIKGDAKGRFNGSVIVSNAEAATIIYKILQVK